MNRKILKTAVEAEETEQIECPICGDEIRADELATDHAHTRELLELLVDLLPEEVDEERLRDGYQEYADRDPWMEEDDADDLISQSSRSSPSMSEDEDGEDTETLRETIIRFDPEGVAPPSMPERLHAHEEGANAEEIASLPERRVFSVGTKEDYERISEAALGVANAFVGSSLHVGYELVACPECGYEGSVDQAVFPAGIDHCSGVENAEEDDGH